jgi:hypothetical protein
MIDPFLYAGVPAIDCKRLKEIAETPGMKSCCSTPSRPFFLPVDCAEGYAVSDAGEVKSLRRKIVRTRGGRSNPNPVESFVGGKVLRPGRMSAGHQSVMLGRAVGSKCVHALVGAAFYPPVSGGEWRHLNHNPADNRLVNLAYGSRSDNLRDNRHGTKRHAALKLLQADVDDLCFSYVSGASKESLMERYDVSRVTVNKWLRIAGLSKGRHGT